MDIKLPRNLLTCHGILLILGLVTVAKAQDTGPGRSQQSRRYCSYSYTGKCEQTVYEPWRCSLVGFRECFRTEERDCDIDYVDCCEGFIMDQDLCYPKDEECDDCYTLTDCNGEVTKLRSREGTIISKNYPEDYDHDVDCNWTIRGGRNSTVLITILDMRIQSRRNLCSWDWDHGKITCAKTCLDWIMLEAGTGQKRRSIRECGTSKNVETFIAPGSVAHVRFHSDDTTANAGFRLVYAIDGGTDPEVPVRETTEAPTTQPQTIPTEVSTIEVTTSEPSTPGVGPRGTPICPGKLVWSSCPLCTRTCNNAIQSEEECLLRSGRQTSGGKNKCEPGCVCPQHLPIWHSLKCATYETCLAAGKSLDVDHCAALGLVKGDCIRTCDNMNATAEKCMAETLVGNSKRSEDGFLCVCKPGTFLHEGRCITSGACQRELNKLCSGGKEWSWCSTKCEETCGERECERRESDAECTGACRCPDDRPIYHENRCIRRRLCPSDGNIICGKQFYKPVLKIMGGEKATKGSWPWLVQIEKRVDGKYTLSCGGTLICEKWVLTASHCFLSAGKTWLDKELWKYRLHIGKHYKKYNQTDVSTGMLSNITPLRIITHEAYHLSTHVNDLALVELPQAVRFNNFIRPACIHNVSDYYPLAALEQTCMAAGWGAESNTEGPGSTRGNPVLKQVELAARTHSLCSALFFNFNIETMHCVGGHKDRDTCAGDSGGPLMCLRNNRWYVDGVVSYGLKCGVRDQPGVYTRIPHYAEWIRKHTGTKCGDPTVVWKS